MEKIVFTEEFCQPENLFPFTLTRQIQDIRVGIFTIREKWENYLGWPSFDKQEDDFKDLDRAIVIDEEIGKDTIYLIHAHVIPTPQLVKQIKKLKPGEFLSLSGIESFAYCITSKQIIGDHKIKVEKSIEVDEELKLINYPWNIFQQNSLAIIQYFNWVKKNRKKQSIPASNRVTDAEKIFIEKGAVIEHCILNASEGPIYIGKDALVMEGTMIRGPVAICDNAVVKMGSRIYGGTTIGPGCTVGGEVKNSVFFGNSNKAHDGYIGDSVIGEWCNMGAGTSNSNIKNNASQVLVYSPNGPVDVGLKCGVIMGDYSKTAINTSINTGTVIGVCCNVFGQGLTPKYISSFSWGNDSIQKYSLEKALTDIENWKKLKGQSLSGAETFILTHIYQHY